MIKIGVTETATRTGESFLIVFQMDGVILPQQTPLGNRH